MWLCVDAFGIYLTAANAVFAEKDGAKVRLEEVGSAITERQAKREKIEIKA